MLQRLKPADVSRARVDPVDPATLAQAAQILSDVRSGGAQALRQHAERLGDLAAAEPLVLGRQQLRDALAALAPGDREVLARTAARIRAFAEVQRRALATVEIPIPGGSVGHTVVPVERAGCYAPGGRFPLPSSVLMTALTARAAGVETVWVASPRPTPPTLAAAAIADADGFLCVGGAQAIAALAFGAGEIPACDAVVGPGNRWVTAAKQLVAGRVAIDMLAGPSELVVLADGSADAALVAADLLGQAEHDPDAFTALVTDSAALAQKVDAALQAQLVGLPTRANAAQALAHGVSVVVADLAEGAQVCNILAPEHLEVQVRDADFVVPLLRHYGALFVGAGAAEVFGDYGVGPNHVLPTSATSRFSGGLSVLTFLRVRTWMRVANSVDADIIRDTAHFARMEGLEAHARAAERRAR